MLRLTVKILPGDSLYHLILDENTSITTLVASVSSLMSSESQEDPSRQYLVFRKNEHIPLSESTLKDSGILNEDLITFAPVLLDADSQEIEVYLRRGGEDMEFKVSFPVTTSGGVLKDYIIETFDIEASASDIILKNYDNSRIISDEDVFEDGQIVMNGDMIVYTVLSINESDNSSEKGECHQGLSRIKEVLRLDEDADIEEVVNEIEQLLTLYRREQDLKQMIERWYDDIANAKFLKVIKEIMTYCRTTGKSEQQLSIINLSARWSLVHKQRTRNVISYDDFMKEVNKLSVALYTTISELEGNYA